jgi:hypothetical protein
MTAVPSIRLNARNGLPIEARFVPFGQPFGPHGRYTNQTGENVVDFYRVKPLRGSVHLLAVAVSHIHELGPDDPLSLGELELPPAEVARLLDWLESPFSAGEDLI